MLVSKQTLCDCPDRLGGRFQMGEGVVIFAFWRQQKIQKVTLKLTLPNLKPDIFTGCHCAQHARSSSGHPRSNWKTARQEEILSLRV